jgi:hypothetical protein
MAIIVFYCLIRALFLWTTSKLDNIFYSRIFKLTWQIENLTVDVIQSKRSLQFVETRWLYNVENPKRDIKLYNVQTTE